MSARAAIYRRQSSDPRNDELGIDRQLAVCERVAAARDFVVETVLTDNDTSASKKDNRPAYAELKELMKSGQVDVVLILRIDRLLRLNDELEELITLVEQYPVRVVTVEGDIDLSTPQGRLLARILVSVARNEIEVKTARAKLANAQRAAQGLPYASHRPYGYDDDRVTIRESEASVLREMARRVLAGHSYREIALWLNAIGQTTARGYKWTPKTVKQILQFKRYIGIREYEAAEYQAQWEPIFDQETWERLQLAIRIKTEGHQLDRPKARKYLLTGLVFCGRCDSAMNGTTKRDRAERPLRRTYACRGTGDRTWFTCGRTQRGAPALDHFVTECVLTRLETPLLTDLIEESKSDTGLSALLDLRNAAQLRLDEVLDDYGSGILTKAEMVRAKAAANCELERLNAQLTKATKDSQRVSIPGGVSIREAWNQAQSDEWKRGVLGLLIKKVVVHPTDAKPVYVVDGVSYRFSPEHVDIQWIV